MFARSAAPKLRLKDASIGQVVRLPGDEAGFTYTVGEVGPGGYINLTHNGKTVITASPGHEIEIIDHE